MRWDFSESFYEKRLEQHKPHNDSAARRINISGQPTLNLSCNMTKRKERLSVNQVVTFKPLSMERIIQAMQTVAHKSYARACQLFCLPVDPLMCEKFICCSASTIQHQVEKNIAETLRNPPSTIMIVNISNSTLIDCVIGDSNPSVVAERQPLMQGSELQKHAQVRCSCTHGQQEEAQTTLPPTPPPSPPLLSGEHQNISIHSSHLNYVIIGDNNYMRAEHNQPLD